MRVRRPEVSMAGWSVRVAPSGSVLRRGAFKSAAVRGFAGLQLLDLLLHLVAQFDERLLFGEQFLADLRRILRITAGEALEGGGFLFERRVRGRDFRDFRAGLLEGDFDVLHLGIGDGRGTGRQQECWSEQDERKE